MNPTKEQREAFEQVFKTNNYNIKIFEGFINDEEEKIINSIVLDISSEELLVLKGQLKFVKALKQCLFK